VIESAERCIGQGKQFAEGRAKVIVKESLLNDKRVHAFDLYSNVSIENHGDVRGSKIEN